MSWLEPSEAEYSEIRHEDTDAYASLCQREPGVLTDGEFRNATEIDIFEDLTEIHAAEDDESGFPRYWDRYVPWSPGTYDFFGYTVAKRAFHK